VFFDGRFRTVYPAEVEAGYQALHWHQGDWQAALERWPPDVVLFPTGHPTTRALDFELDGWRLIHRDQTASLLLREGSPALSRWHELRGDRAVVYPDLREPSFFP
jgi:hypothetical protein